MNYRLILVLYLSSTILTLEGQISVTQSDLQSNFQIGQVLVSNSDTTARMYDIGAPGMGNSWDFSNAVANLSFEQLIVNPSGTPFSMDFSDADFATFGTVQGDGFTSTTYSYQVLGNDRFTSLGSGGTTSVGGVESTSKSVYTPELVNLTFPVELGDSWTYEGELATETGFAGLPVNTSVADINSSYSIDAAGTLKLPGGAMMDALRMKEVTTNTIEVIPGMPTETTSTSYLFLTKAGASISFSPTSLDNIPDNGMVEGTITWTGTASNATSVLDLESLGYKLDMIYPNPVTEQTNINYYLPETTDLQIKLTNASGQLVQTLVNYSQPSGDHQITLDVTDLPSGLYWISLQVNNGLISRAVFVNK